jgi:2-dehydropantoate 2-reductase
MTAKAGPARPPIIIVGPGAIGTTLAVHLARSGAAVTLLDHRADRAAILRRQGLRLATPGGLLTAAVGVETSAARLPEAGLVIVCVKCYRLAEVGRELSQLPGPGATLVTIENGLGVTEALKAGLGSAAARHTVLAAVTYQAASPGVDGVIRHVANLPTLFDGRAEVQGAAKVAAEVFEVAGLPARLDPELLQAVWRKLVANAAINPLTALEHVANGQLLDRAPLRRRMLALARETALAARGEGVAISDAEAEELALAAARATGANISSMRQDVEAGRPTEIEFLSGAVLRLAEARGLDLPETERVTAAIRALQKS